MVPAPAPPAPSRSPLRAALLPQLFGLFAAIVMGLVKPSLLNHPLALAVIQSLFAAWIARMRGAPIWWQAIHLFFTPLLVALNALHLPPLLWLGGFILLFLVYWRTDVSRVPLYLSNSTTGDALAELIPPHPCFVIDLGCGTGGLLRQIAQIRPDCQFIGVEHAPIPYLLSRWNNRRLGNVEIRLGDLWTISLRGFHLVYAFLSPEPMPRLWQKAVDEMPPGALLVSNSFAVPDQVPAREVAVDDRRQTRLYCYRPTPEEEAGGE